MYVWLRELSCSEFLFCIFLADSEGFRSFSIQKSWQQVFSAYQWDKQHSDSESCSSSMTAAAWSQDNVPWPAVHHL